MQRSDYISEDQQLNKINELYTGLISVCDNYINDYHMFKNKHEKWARAFQKTIQTLDTKISNDISNKHKDVYEEEPDLKIAAPIISLLVLVKYLKDSLSRNQSDKFLSYVNNYINRYNMSALMEEITKNLPDSLENKLKYASECARANEYADEYNIQKIHDDLCANVKSLIPFKESIESFLNAIPEPAQTAGPNEYMLTNMTRKP